MNYYTHDAGCFCKSCTAEREQEEAGWAAIAAIKRLIRAAEEEMNSDRLTDKELLNKLEQTIHSVNKELNKMEI